MPLSPLADSYKVFLVRDAHSVSVVKRLANELNSISEVNALLELCSSEQSYPTPELAVWTIRHGAFKFPDLQPYICSKLLGTLKQINRDSYIKNVLGVIKHHPIPEESFGKLADICLTYLTEPFRSKAVIYYSVEIMTFICKKVPELGREFLMIAQELEPLASDALKRKLVKVRKALN